MATREQLAQQVYTIIIGDGGDKEKFDSENAITLKLLNEDSAEYQATHELVNAKLRERAAAMGMEVMTPDSPRWDEFCNALSQTLYISETEWRCDGDIHQAGALVHAYAKYIMAEMGNIDIPASLAFFRSRGGFCDCEILFNVDRDRQEAS
jgi:hypothetical protein